MGIEGGMVDFVLTGQCYQMAIPPRLTISIVKAAVLRYAETEDAEYYLHPEHLATTMSATEAEEWQRRLRCMDERQRNADRATLLELDAPRSRHC